MRYEKETNVICLGDPKQSALYFDSIIPISYIFQLATNPEFLRVVEEYGLLEAEDATSLPKEVYRRFTNEENILKSLIEKEEYYEKDIIRPYFEYFMSILNSCLLVARLSSLRKGLQNRTQNEAKEPLFGELSKHTLQLLNAIWMKIERFDLHGYTDLARDILDLMCLFYLEDVRLFKKESSFRVKFDTIPAVKSGRRRIILPSYSFKYYDASEEDLTVYLSNIKLVDTSKTDWSQIIEFRKDKEARKKLRNLRLFLHTNYKGKTSAFVEDDLNRLLEDYQRACKDWGFETTVSTLTTLMDSNGLQASIAASLAIAVFGEPIYGVPFLAPSLIELGKIGLGFAKRKHAFHKLKRNHDLAYIIEAKERLE